MAKVTVGGTGNWEELTDFSFEIDRNTIGLTRSFKLPNIDGGDIDTTNQVVFDFLEDCYPANSFTPGQFINTAFRAYVDTVKIVPFQGENERSKCGSDGTGDVAAYEAYKATVTYSRLDYGDGDDSSDDPETGNVEIAKISRTFGTETLLKPDWAMYWSSDSTSPVPKEIRVPQVIPFIEYRIEYPRIRVNMIPESSIAALAGHVNKNKFSNSNSLFKGAAAESVMFVGADTTITAGSDGSILNTMGLTFRRRILKDENGLAIGWNHFYNPSSADGAKVWDKLLSEPKGGATGDKPTYPLANSFYPLFNIRF